VHLGSLVQVNKAMHLGKESTSDAAVSAPSDASLPLQPVVADVDEELGALPASAPEQQPASAPPEPVSEGPHSSLHAVTLAWRALLPEAAPTTPTGGGGVADESAIAVEPLLKACAVATSVCELFGSLMAPAVKNDRVHAPRA
jgi:hypothetical protein